MFTKYTKKKANDNNDNNDNKANIMRRVVSKSVESINAISVQSDNDNIDSFPHIRKYKQRSMTDIEINELYDLNENEGEWHTTNTPTLNLRISDDKLPNKNNANKNDLNENEQEIKHTKTTTFRLPKLRTKRVWM